MPAKTGSRNGLSYGWALGENNWNTGMDGNLTFIDRFGVHLSFKSFLNTPPGSPAAGDCHVIDTVPTGVWVGKAGQVAVYDDGAWRYGVPRTGWRAYCEADERLYVYDGGWALTASEWSAATVGQAEAEAGTATTRRAWTAQRVRQAIAAWWNSAKGALVGPIGINGDLEFTGTASRIRGDFSNATLANRLMFQSSTVNGATDVGVTPNGTSTTAGFTAYNAADPTNASTTTLQTTSTQSKLIAGKAGSGSYKPLVLNVNGVDAFQLDTSGNSLHTNPAGGLGYGTNAGGTVTQTTSKSTEVTLNRPCGRITMHNQTLAGGGEAQFQINNWLIAASDFPEVQSLWSGVYWARVVAWGDGYAAVVLKNTTGAPYSDNVQIYFNLKKGSFV